MHADINHLTDNEKIGYRQVKDGLQDTYILRVGDVVCHGGYYVNHKVEAGVLITPANAGRAFKELTMQNPGDYWSCWTKGKIDKPAKRAFVPKSLFHATPLPLP